MISAAKPAINRDNQTMGSSTGSEPQSSLASGFGAGIADIKDHLPELTHPDGSPVRALVVDDEPMLADLVAMGLTICGWHVKVAHAGRAAVETAREFAPDVLVLDWMLPELNGLEVLAKVRISQPNVPALFLTAKDAVADRIEGLSAGGDDYVTKPFSIEEVLIRLHRIVERSGLVTKESDELVVGDLAMNTRTHEVTRGGDHIELTATQFELLRYLMENPRSVLSKTQILERVWDYDFGGNSNIVELYISYLRKKIDVDRDPMIHTVRGVGYVLRPV
ncbi:two-component system, OmpR family, response regulator [Micrococcales bacterium KH10]|nr:two-component system, OmpR family, response regulator [Micrococcales bacterium KH10]